MPKKSEGKSYFCGEFSLLLGVFLCLLRLLLLLHVLFGLGPALLDVTLGLLHWFCDLCQLDEGINGDFSLAQLQKK